MTDKVSESATTPRVVKLPNKHAHDWFDRLGYGHGAEIVDQTERTITLRLPDEALCDMISDALYYAEEMGPDNTGDIDYRPAARRLLRALERRGIEYTRRSFSITLKEKN